MKHACRTPLILVADDDPSITCMLEGVLESAGFCTASASTAAEAMAKFQGVNPDLVLLDVQLPDGNGFDVCRQIHAAAGAASTPILFISAGDNPTIKVKGFEAGGVDYITKPLYGAEILARVSTHLRLKHAYERLAELQTEQIKRLVGAQEAIMPNPQDYPEARFCVGLDQVLQAGGDFYDVIPVGNSVMDFVVADGSGHDLAASFWTAALKTLLAEYASSASRPREIVHRLNQALCRVLPEGTYFTLIYARLNRQTGRLVLVNAGHPPAVVCHAEITRPAMVEQVGDVAGAFADASFDVAEISVKPGDRFFLYSDGLIELHGPRPVGQGKLLAACEQWRAAPLEQAVRLIRQTVQANALAADDVLLLGVDV